MSSLNHSANDAVRNLLCLAVPERQKEIRVMWAQYDVNIAIEPDRMGCYMNAGGSKISFDAKTMEAYWIIGFNGWSAIKAYAPAVLISVRLGDTVDGVISKDEELGSIEWGLRAINDLGIRVLESGNVLTRDEWPKGLPYSSINRDELSSDEEKAAYDLVVLGVAYAFFHELMHVKFYCDGVDKDRAEEELGADVIARAFMLDKCGLYCEECDVDYSELYQKRMMGIALGGYILHQITPMNYRGGSLEYPPIRCRLQALVSKVSLPSNSNYSLYLACLMIAIYRQTHRPIDIRTDDLLMLAESLLADL